MCAASMRRRSAASRGRMSKLPQPRFQRFGGRARGYSMRGADALAQAVVLLVDVLQAAADAPVQHAQRAIDTLLPKAPLQHRHAVAHGLGGLGARRGDPVEQFLARADHQSRPPRRAWARAGPPRNRRS